MARFSERTGITPVKSAIQLDSMDDDLRISLWNALSDHYWHSMHDAYSLSRHPHLQVLVHKMWRDFFKLPTDVISASWGPMRESLKKWFFTCEWYQVYDFVQFVADEGTIPTVNAHFIDACNFILQREVSGHRFVGGQLTPLTSESQIVAVEEAVAAGQSSQPLGLVSSHLQRALTLLSDRQTPDYRNSIKESISAVEAICKLIAGKPNATLGPALDAIEKGNIVQLHPSLKDGFQRLYGFTSDAAGIRHAMKDASTVDQEDAMYMLVSCSAFVNYLVTKAGKAGVTL
jgi:AbiJ N-terminal domain 4